MITFINGEITEKSANDFIKSMRDEEIEVRIDSMGGDLFAGLKMFEKLKSHPHPVSMFVDGVSGSIASVIMLAGDKLPQIASTGSVMIHNALIPKASGNHNDLRKVANTLETYSQIIAKVYADHTKLSFDEAIELMNDETPINSEDAVKLGFASEIIEPLKAVAHITKIDMNLLDRIKAGLKNEVLPTEEIENVEGEETATEETATETGFTPEQLAQLEEIISAMIAEALAGNTEEVGNTIATVLNSIVSNGSVDTTPVNNTVAPAPVKSGIEAFNAKMKEIKDQN